MSNKTLLKEVFEQLLERITPEKLIQQQCQFDGKVLSVKENSYELGNYKNIYILGSGKAVIPMAKAMNELLKGHVCKTLIVGAYKNEEKIENCTYVQSTHPLPSQASIKAAQELQKLIKTFKEEDLYIYLLSGGSSALIELPEENITLKEFQEATSLMLLGGIPIEMMNCVRKHLSQVKGGKLAKSAKASGIVLVLSDVIGDDLHAIGSAPLYCDSTTFADAIAGLKAYNLFEKMPQSIQTFLTEGGKGHHQETPKSPQANIVHHILGSNNLVLQKAKTLLQEKGIKTTIIDKSLQGDAAELAKEFISFIDSFKGEAHCFLYGGEPTVIVKGEGKGGRNQHLCLHVLSLLGEKKEVTFLSAATDGIDGNSNSAGAIINQDSRINALSHHLNPHEYLDNCDSNTFFAKTEELLISGPTHNNLLDIVMILIGTKH